jgi:hypothetical protein
VCSTWSRVTWKGELAVTLSMADGGAWRAGGWPAATFVAGAAPVLATKGRRLNAAVRRCLGRCVRQGDGGRTGGQWRGARSASAGTPHGGRGLQGDLGARDALGRRAASGRRGPGRREARTPRWRGTGVRGAERGWLEIISQCPCLNVKISKNLNRSAQSGE